jgi:hypothetical protein
MCGVLLAGRKSLLRMREMWFGEAEIASIDRAIAAVDKLVSEYAASSAEEGPRLRGVGAGT